MRQELLPNETLYTLEIINSSNSSDTSDTLNTIINNQEHTQDAYNLLKTTSSESLYCIHHITLPPLSYQQNWLVILAASDMLGLLNKADQSFSLPDLTLPQHRLDKIPTKKGITFYNDSKSTIIESTLAAVNHLKDQRIHLLLGGLSKGVDRTAYIPQFKDKVASITCFGAESETLYKACIAANIPALKDQTLQGAFNQCTTRAQPGDTVLLSPAGSSYDLYKIYTERGDDFVKLVRGFDSV
jgi:UDP-N-acetylmuramoylalanine-D-glutamate ligase